MVGDYSWARRPRRRYAPTARSGGETASHAYCAGTSALRARRYLKVRRALAPGSTGGAARGRRRRSGCDLAPDRSVVLVLDGARDATTRRHLDAVLLGPQPNGFRVPSVGRPTGATSAAARAVRRPHWPSCLPESIEAPRQGAQVLFTEVDLSPLTLPADPDSLGIFAAVQIVRDPLKYFPGHCATPHTAWGTGVESSGSVPRNRFNSSACAVCRRTPRRPFDRQWRPLADGEPLLTDRAVLEASGLGHHPAFFRLAWRSPLQCRGVLRRTPPDLAATVARRRVDTH